MSAVWFPEKERALATSLGASPRALASGPPPHPLTCGLTGLGPASAASMFNLIGIAVAFLTSPILITTEPVAIADGASSAADVAHPRRLAPPHVRTHPPTTVASQQWISCSWSR